MKIFNTVISLLLLGLFPQLLPAQPNVQKLPATFEANQIYVETITESQDTIKFFTDTGGGAIFITEKLSKELNLEIEEERLRGRSMMLTVLPNLLSQHQIPFMPQEYASENETILNEKKEVYGNRIMVMPPPTGLNKKLEEEGITNEGMLGQDWFATRIWTFDYEKEELLLHDFYDLDKSEKHVADIFFQTDDGGRHTHHMPRIKAEIDGKQIDFLFDTGATTFMSDKALEQINDGLPSIRGASYITQSQFEKWSRDHPEWRVIEKGEKFSGAPYIEVPEVTIAGHTVGPVWFTVRPDQAFHQYMASMMDTHVNGALGGSLFQYFKITVHYPKEYAVFEPTKK